MLDRHLEKKIIDKYMQVPYRHHGRTMDGLDCYGLIKCIKEEQGFSVYDINEEYDENWVFSSGRNYFIENYHRDWIRLDVCKPGDVVLFKTKLRYYDESGAVCVRSITNHGGVVISNQRFIHICKMGTLITELTNSRWVRKIDGFYRLKVEND